MEYIRHSSFTRFLVLLCFLIVFTCNGQALNKDKIYVIVNNTVKAKSVTKSELKRIFLGKKKYLHGMPLKVFFLPLNSKATQVFCKEVLHIPPYKFKSQLKSLMSSGRISIPRKLKNPIKMILKVSNKKGAIGYVDKKWVIAHKNRFFRRLNISKESYI